MTSINASYWITGKCVASVKFSTPQSSLSSCTTFALSVFFFSLSLALVYFTYVLLFNYVLLNSLSFMFPCG